MEQLPCFTLHPCIEKSRVRVGRGLQEDKERALELTMDGDGDEDGDALDAWERC